MFKHTVIFTFVSRINLLKIKLRHARKGAITGTRMYSALSCLTSLLKEARFYKSYTQQVRLKS